MYNGWERIKAQCVPVPQKSKLSEDRIQLDNSWSLKTTGNYEGEEWIVGFGVSKDKGEKKICLKLDPKSLSNEAYKIRIMEDLIEIVAGSEIGFRYAFETCYQLSADGAIPIGEIEDQPTLAIRGFHLNLDSYRQLTFEDAKYLIENAGRMKINTLLVEYSNRFPFEKYRQINSPAAFHKDEIIELVKIAKNNFINIIPLQQSIGHLGYLSDHDTFSSYREENSFKDQLCPLNPNSTKLIKELIEEILALHPNTTHFHIGGDETRRLGSCVKCQDKVNRQGVSKLYVDYINEISDWLISKQITPLIWDDMVCAHPEALNDLNKEIVILYWDYWAVSRKSPFFVARYGRRGRPAIVYDQRWDSEWKNELTELEKSVMKTYGHAVPLEKNLGQDFLDLFGDYLGDEFPKRIRSYPYLEFYKNKGFKVIAGPTAGNKGDNYYSMPNYWRHIPNIEVACRRCEEVQGEGVITTAWHNSMPLMAHLGLAATAQYAWSASFEALRQLERNTLSQIGQKCVEKFDT